MKISNTNSTDGGCKSNFPILEKCCLLGVKGHKFLRNFVIPTQLAHFSMYSHLVVYSVLWVLRVVFKTQYPIPTRDHISKFWSDCGEWKQTLRAACSSVDLNVKTKKDRVAHTECPIQCMSVHVKIMRAWKCAWVWILTVCTLLYAHSYACSNCGGKIPLWLNGAKGNWDNRSHATLPLKPWRKLKVWKKVTEWNGLITSVRI